MFHEYTRSCLIKVQQVKRFTCSPYMLTFCIFHHICILVHHICSMFVSSFKLRSTMLHNYNVPPWWRCIILSTHACLSPLGTKIFQAAESHMHPQLFLLVNWQTLVKFVPSCLGLLSSYEDRNTLFFVKFVYQRYGKNHHSSGFIALWCESTIQVFVRFHTSLHVLFPILLSWNIHYLGLKYKHVIK